MQPGPFFNRVRAAEVRGYRPRRPVEFQ